MSNQTKKLRGLNVLFFSLIQKELFGRVVKRDLLGRALIIAFNVRTFELVIINVRTRWVFIASKINITNDEWNEIMKKSFFYYQPIFIRYINKTQDFVKTKILSIDWFSSRVVWEDTCEEAFYRWSWSVTLLYVERYCSFMKHFATWSNGVQWI